MSEIIVRLKDIKGSVHTGGAFSHPNWEVIGRWIEQHVSEPSMNDAWIDIASQWLGMLVAQLPSGYQLHESDEFMLVTREHEENAHRLIRWCEKYHRKIVDALGSVASDIGYGKHVVIAFSDLELYYDYIDAFYVGEGEFGGSGGIFLDHGYGHIVLPTVDWSTERTIVHELTHSLLCHLTIPMWLDEGVTQVMEDIVLESSNFQMDAELAYRHKAYWHRLTLEPFWSGEAFSSTDEGQELAYSLAQVLVRNMMSDYARSFSKFLLAADYADAGEAASIAVFDVGLGHHASQFLGQGKWAPAASYALPDASQSS